MLTFKPDTQGHTRQGLVNCRWPGCEKEFVKGYLNMHMKRTRENTNQFKCTFEGCTFLNKYKFILNAI